MSLSLWYNHWEQVTLFKIPLGKSQFNLNVSDSDKEQGFDSLVVRCSKKRDSQWDYAADIACNIMTVGQRGQRPGYVILLYFSGT